MKHVTSWPRAAPAVARVVTLMCVVGLAAVSSAGAAIRPALRASTATGAPCAWQLQYTNGQETGTDTNASYWATTMVSDPGVQLTFQGAYPTARYMAYAMYDGPDDLAISGLSHLHDSLLAPASGVNRFQTGKTGAGTYALTVVAGAAPRRPPANTIYTGTTDGDTVSIIYRVYDTNVAGDPTGGAGLPSETSSVNGGNVQSYGGCYSGADSSSAPEFPSPSRLLRSDALSGEPSVPEWGVPPSNTQAAASFRDPDNAYLGAYLYPNTNEVVVFRMKTPSFPDTDTGQPPWQQGKQVRYWSICEQYDVFDVVAGCLDDANTVTSGGYATFVISTAANRPTNAIPQDGINWLELQPADVAPDPPYVVVYRQLLASSLYFQSISHVFLRGLPELTMGAYYPTSAYCTVTTFEQSGPTACLRSR